MYAARGGIVDAQELLDRPTQTLVVGRRGHVVHPVGVRDAAVVGLGLEELLGAAVEVADDRLGVDDPLAVDPHHDAQHAVGRRVLRPEGDLHLLAVGRTGAGRQLAHASPSVLGPGPPPGG